MGRGGHVGSVVRLTGGTRMEPVRSEASPGERLCFLGAPGWQDVEVAGEGYYLQEIVSLFRSWGMDEGGTTTRVAALVPEPSNRYNKDAVKVMIDNLPVGYVPAVDAARLKAYCAQVPLGLVPACSVRLRATCTAGAWRARVTLTFPGRGEPMPRAAVDGAQRREQAHGR